MESDSFRSQPTNLQKGKGQVLRFRMFGPHCVWWFINFVCVREGSGLGRSPTLCRAMMDYPKGAGTRGKPAPGKCLSGRPQKKRFSLLGVKFVRVWNWIWGPGASVDEICLFHYGNYFCGCGWDLALPKQKFVWKVTGTKFDEWHDIISSIKPMQII